MEFPKEGDFYHFDLSITRLKYEWIAELDDWNLLPSRATSPADHFARGLIGADGRGSDVRYRSKGAAVKLEDWHDSRGYAGIPATSVRDLVKKKKGIYQKLETELGLGKGIN